MKALAISAALFVLGIFQTTALTLSKPLDYQVIQRGGKNALPIVGVVDHVGSIIEARLTIGGKSQAWKKLNVVMNERAFTASLTIPSGGWHSLEVRAKAPDQSTKSVNIAHVGAGEIFVIAGQSNSANFGEALTSPQSGMVVNFDGKSWRPAADPQPGADGSGGSFIPTFGDLTNKYFGVPVAVITCGSGGTSVREWQPQGTTFTKPPTREGNTLRNDDGTWMSNGRLYNQLVSRMKELGTNGFRAVLWHQGESDANQADPNRTLTEKEYRSMLENLIVTSRKDIGWQAPWMVAQVSYHSPEQPSSNPIRAAQASLWKDGIALQGPDSDSLTGSHRDQGGRGIHLSKQGLVRHGTLWYRDVCRWISYEMIQRKPDVPYFAYGEHPKQRMHVWKAKSERPTPVIVFMHGGGWTNGDLNKSVWAYAEKPLKEGVSFISLGYRFVDEAGDMVPPVKAPMYDAARAIQTIRHHAKEWNIDPSRIAMWGGSAGGCSTLWLTYHDDLADAKSADPISRQSTRLFIAAAKYPQTTLDPKQMREWMPDSRYGAHAFPVDAKGFTNSFDALVAQREQVLQHIREFSPIEHVSADDPEVFMTFDHAPAMGKATADPTHSANFGVGLIERCKEKNVSCDMHYLGKKDSRWTDVTDFLIEKLKAN